MTDQMSNTVRVYGPYGIDRREMVEGERERIARAYVAARLSALYQEQSLRWGDFHQQLRRCHFPDEVVAALFPASPPALPMGDIPRCLCGHLRTDHLTAASTFAPCMRDDCRCQDFEESMPGSPAPSGEKT